MTLGGAYEPKKAVTPYQTAMSQMPLYSRAGQVR
jgi:hypothetical protein